MQIARVWSTSYMEERSSFLFARDGECVAVASESGVGVHNLECGHVMWELYDEGAAHLGSIAMTIEGCAVLWRFAGCNDGSARVWDMDTELCVSTLRPMFGLPASWSRRVAIATGRHRVVHFLAPFMDNLEGCRLHVWDLSSDRTQERYELVHGCKNEIVLEVASAALLYHDAKRRVELGSSRSVRFEWRQKLRRKIFLLIGVLNRERRVVSRLLTRWRCRKRPIRCCT
jgi:hypothetical protein